MIPVSSQVLADELGGAKTILDKWLGSIQEGVPSLDRPGTDMELMLWVQQFCGELLVAAGKLETLANVLTGER